MISPYQEEIVILGAGIAGLATGLELARRGRAVTLIEQGHEVGGLARTFVQSTPAGDFRFDIGGHRFHSRREDVTQWLQALMGIDLLRVPRVSHIYLSNGHGPGKLVDYPLRFPGALKIFPPHQATQILSSYVGAAVQRRLQPNHVDLSFEDWVVRRFGRTLYEIYFKPYTEKVWGIPCTTLSAEWAKQRIGLPSLLQAVREALLPSATTPATAISHFWYPRQGFGMIPARMRAKIERLGGRVLTGVQLRAITPIISSQGSTPSYSITIEDQRGLHQLHAARLVSTIPLNFLLQALPPETGSPAIQAEFELRYRDMIIIFLALAREQVSEDSWTYFPARNLMIGRTHEPRNWSSEMVPPGYTSLVVEVFTSQGDDYWALSDEALSARAVADLTTTGLIAPTQVYASWVRRIHYAYPVYDIGYHARLQRVRGFLSQWPNLHLVGRTGSFRYLNSDGVIEDALALSDYLTGVRSAPLDVSLDYRVD